MKNKRTKKRKNSQLFIWKGEARNSMQPMRNSIEKQPDKVLNKYTKLHLK